MTRTFKRKDLLYLKRVLVNRDLSQKTRRIVLGVCRYLNDSSYREVAPHEEGKIIINR